VAITEQGLRNGMVSVRLSRHGPEHQTLLPAGDIDRLLHGAQHNSAAVQCHCHIVSVRSFTDTDLLHLVFKIHLIIQFDSNLAMFFC